jgi:predicted deacylase
VRGRGDKVERGRVVGRSYDSSVIGGRAWEVRRPKRAEGSALVKDWGARRRPAF